MVLNKTEISYHEKTSFQSRNITTGRAQIQLEKSFYPKLDEQLTVRLLIRRVK